MAEAQNSITTSDGHRAELSSRQRRQRALERADGGPDHPDDAHPCGKESTD